MPGTEIMVTYAQTSTCVAYNDINHKWATFHLYFPTGLTKSHKYEMGI